MRKELKNVHTFIHKRLRSGNVSLNHAPINHPRLIIRLKLIRYPSIICSTVWPTRITWTGDGIASSLSKAIHGLTIMITGNRFGKLLRQTWHALRRTQKAPRSIKTPICPPIELPNEIVLQFLEYMPVRSLISCKSVCSTWRHLIPLANLLPAPSTAPKFLWLGHKLPQKRQKEVFARDRYIIELFIRCFQTLDSFFLWMEEWPGRFELRYIQVLRSDRHGWLHLELFLGRISVGLVRTKPICYSEHTQDPQHEGHKYPCPLLYISGVDGSQLTINHS